MQSNLKLDSAVFYTRDIPKVVDFYTKTIGLELEYRQGDKFASFKFADGTRLGIKKAVEDREQPGTGTIFVATADIEPLYERLQSIGANIRKQLVHTEGFGRNFSILDPDGNKVQFIERRDH